MAYRGKAPFCCFLFLAVLIILKIEETYAIIGIITRYDNTI